MLHRQKGGTIRPHQYEPPYYPPPSPDTPSEHYFHVQRVNLNQAARDDDETQTRRYLYWVGGSPAYYRFRYPDGRVADAPYVSHNPNPMQLRHIFGAVGMFYFILWLMWRGFLLLLPLDLP